jgi:hypothetical protein
LVLLFGLSALLKTILRQISMDCEQNLTKVADIALRCPRPRSSGRNEYTTRTQGEELRRYDAARTAQRAIPTIMQTATG